MIVPDYARPAALMVPYFWSDLLSVFEDVACAAAAHVGVILLSHYPGSALDFVARQRDADRFTIVAADHDTPWIRDRSPVAVRERAGVRWVLPKMPDLERKQDDELFARIVAREQVPSTILIAQGNLVAGPGGLAVSSTAVLIENNLTLEGLRSVAPQFGIRRWLIFPPFGRETSRHADIHVRFLRRDLVAVAWNPDDAGDQHVTLGLEAMLAKALPSARLLRIPVRAQGDRYASPLNWIQLGREVLLPVYSATPHDDVELATDVLAVEGFHVTPIESPTLGMGGSLHCLTASTFV